MRVWLGGLEDTGFEGLQSRLAGAVQKPGVPLVLVFEEIISVRLLQVMGIFLSCHRCRDRVYGILGIMRRSFCLK